MVELPTVPDWIREFHHQDWTNVFHIVPSTEGLYPIAREVDWKAQFNDWNGRLLLLAQDGCPPDIIRERVAKGEQQPWRYGERGEKGSRTNKRLYQFASEVPGGKLYGSAAAHMLYNGPGMSRRLEQFDSGPLQEFLQKVLCWVLESMPRVEWVACLGEKAWLLTCNVIGVPFAAQRFDYYRKSRRPVIGKVGKKKIAAFPLYHPAALGKAINTMVDGWRAFGSLLSSDEVVDEYFHASAPALVSNARPEFVKGKSPVRKLGPSAKRVTTARLLKRTCRVQFMAQGKLVHTSPMYNSSNTWQKIIAYARTKRGGAPGNVLLAAVAQPQVFTSGRWIDVNE